MDVDPLARLKRAAARKRRADEEVRAALLAAREDGATFPEIGAALGMSKQGARKAWAALSRPKA